jgi:hypothetical protein
MPGMLGSVPGQGVERARLGSPAEGGDPKNGHKKTDRDEDIDSAEALDYRPGGTCE